jgi:hypothetical protein
MHLQLSITYNARYLPSALKFSILILALFLLPFPQVVEAQNIRELTLGIIDTNSSKYDQAYDIYSWVTNNIKYDTRAYKERDQTRKTLSEILKSKQGLCYEFSLLYSEMCNSVDIEAYIIHGYSKENTYNRQKPFLRSNHAWNVAYLNNRWVHVDATRGNVYITRKPGTISKIISSVSGKGYTNNKLSFVHAPVDTYFDIPIDTLVESHYPLDPKWLLSATPLSFEAYLSDTINSNAHYPFYTSEIEKIRNTSYPNLLKIEGANGNIYNSLNYFDKAFGNYSYAANYNIEQELTTENKYRFEKYMGDFEIILSSIDKHKQLTDSVYKARTKKLKEVARQQKRLTGRIKSKAKKAQSTHRSSQKQIVGKNSSYNKKMNGYQINIGRTELKRIPFFIIRDLQYTDTLEYERLLNEVSVLKEQQPRLKYQLDSLIKVVDNFSYIDAQIDDSIALANTLFKTNIEVLTEMVLSGNEKTITDYVDSLQLIYQDIEDFLSDKKNAKNDLQNTGRTFYSTSAELIKNLKAELALYSKLLKVTKNADTLIRANNACVDDIIYCYKKSMIFTKKLTNHNDIQSDLRDQNLKALKEQKKRISKENQFFEAWYDDHLKKEKEEYANEKELIKLIRTSTLRNQKKTEMKLTKFEEYQNTE